MVITLKFIYLPVIDTHALYLDLADIVYCLFHCSVIPHYTHEEAAMSTFLYCKGWACYVT